MGSRIVGRERRKLRIRHTVSGTPERPRLTVFRSLKHMYAQVVDDVAGATLVHASTLSKDIKPLAEDLDKSKSAEKVGETIAKLLLAKGVKKVVFDRNGYMYHGRVKALAEAARKAGLEF
ncbi:MAG: 50S ribosomal protein L18 [Labilithrix sp.]|nr:50S ribosomal protein L18 [Labilithrix sp.]